jgi:hypothetical protein
MTIESVERIFKGIIFGLIGLALVLIAMQASAEPHVFANGLHLQGMVQDAEDSKVAEARLQGYVGGLIDVAWVSADSSCTGTPDYTKIADLLAEILKGTKDQQLSVSPAWLLVATAIRFSYPACFAGEAEVSL